MPTMTADQRRELDRATHDAYMRACPSAQLLGILSDKWVCLVLCALDDGSMRYSEVRRKIPSVSQKMLTQTLRTLERDGFVLRTVTAAVPVRVDYELSELGRRIQPLVAAIKSFAEENITEVLVARSEFDAVS
ncbi:transcriptional regulator [Rhodococcus sp. 06-462-5]|uniref:winged helix-turn-helix transcriptional regulator n=1 Tax=unclassified Rhodococcus (in: high G+C Gram-positive bacteria) TaxID=192944 RepID=UPI000B9BB7E0|nr:MULTISPECIES: helix-turn-helix domain-containing protein [unclassified Rhodococcus (in: high G+C Gram-positive bacteria)]OZC77910.1 transcriptional regulator [Rhodococcus sp. 06-462-5]OZE61761.1 transcriptional regulator [Rhodococcus sp. 02-925g]